MARFPNTGNKGRRTVLALGRDEFSITEFERSLGHAGGSKAGSWLCAFNSLEGPAPKITYSVFLSGHHQSWKPWWSKGSTLNEKRLNKYRALKALPFKGKAEGKELEKRWSQRCTWPKRETSRATGNFKKKYLLVLRVQPRAN